LLALAIEVKAAASIKEFIVSASAALIVIVIKSLAAKGAIIPLSSTVVVLPLMTDPTTSILI